MSRAATFNAAAKKHRPSVNAYCTTTMAGSQRIAKPGRATSTINSANRTGNATASENKLAVTDTIGKAATGNPGWETRLGFEVIAAVPSVTAACSHVQARMPI